MAPVSVLGETYCGLRNGSFSNTEFFCSLVFQSDFSYYCIVPRISTPNSFHFLVLLLLVYFFCSCYCLIFGYVSVFFVESLLQWTISRSSVPFWHGLFPLVSVDRTLERLLSGRRRYRQSHTKEPTSVLLSLYKIGWNDGSKVKIVNWVLQEVSLKGEVLGQIPVHNVNQQSRVIEN